ncbi:hypothetical protein O3P69_005934 [Scylla paramamosain]|uniref:Uncharacterized protein n=1 Tax=Scylla paramamosain TaxID=85552 RepID=A0AAW0U479_SCYPA
MKVAFLLLLGICVAWAGGPQRRDVPSFQKPHPDPRPPSFQKPHVDPTPPPFQRPHVDPTPPPFQRPHVDPTPPFPHNPQPYRGRRDVHMRPAAGPDTGAV